jgi:hypothetical protein
MRQRRFSHGTRRRSFAAFAPSSPFLRITVSSAAASFRSRLRADLSQSEAELEWVRELANEIDSGALEGVAEWRRWHQEGGEALVIKLVEAGQGASRRRSF